MSTISAPASRSQSAPWCQSASISAGMPSTRYSVGMPMRLPRMSPTSAASKSGTGRGGGGRVLRVVAGHRLQHDRGVAHGLRHRAGLVERRGEGDDAPARAAAVGRLDADDAGEGGRLADRAAGVGAGGAEHEVGGDRGSRAARGAAGGERRGVAGAPPRADRRAVDRGLVRAAHGELVHVELADADRAGLPEPARSPCSRRAGGSLRGCARRPGSARPRRRRGP